MSFPKEDKLNCITTCIACQTVWINPLDYTGIEYGSQKQAGQILLTTIIFPISVGKQHVHTLLLMHKKPQHSYLSVENYLYKIFYSMTI